MICKWANSWCWYTLITIKLRYGNTGWRGRGEEVGVGGRATPKKRGTLWKNRDFWCIFGLNADLWGYQITLGQGYCSLCWRHTWLEQFILLFGFLVVLGVVWGYVWKAIGAKIVKFDNFSISFGLKPEVVVQPLRHDYKKDLWSSSSKCIHLIVTLVSGSCLTCPNRCPTPLKNRIF